ncbi:2'-5'-oligoadenylate synthase 1 [Ochotona curzoniae]|uniref:2'-5'-oligoadenylate synthase 1 n=1 Tax=Ochotona curzoniae TaxID=130825 RepID=UPI001B34F8E3|nr:2'-5'-oligoadenylate synthase 1 [Ochotona curzoniae]
MMELKETPAKLLDKFIEEQLLPNTRFREQVKEAVHIICSFLKERCFRGASHPVRVSKVVKGGSSGKGTALKGRSDADLVVFLTNLTSFREQLDKRGEFITEIKTQLEACQREEQFQVRFAISKWDNPRVLSFVLSSRQLEEEVEFDVLPAYDALGQITKNCRPEPQVYIDLIKECTSQGKEGEFSTCFTELQRNFLKQRPTKLKSLIRLVKYWYQTCKKELKKSLPPQYALELLTVYAWEQGSGKTEFDMAEGFRTVLELVMKYQSLRIYWKKYYDFSDPTIKSYLTKKLAKSRPVILDPADPTGNAAGENLERWQWLAEAAERWLSFPCFRKWNGTPVDSWDVSPEVEVPVETLGYGSGVSRTYRDVDCHHQPVLTPQKEDSWTCIIL